jgi:hypothetical protein
LKNGIESVKNLLSSFINEFKERENESFSEECLGNHLACDDCDDDGLPEPNPLQDESGLQDAQNLSKGKDPRED